MESCGSRRWRGGSVAGVRTVAIVLAVLVFVSSQVFLLCKYDRRCSHKHGNVWPRLPSWLTENEASFERAKQQDEEVQNDVEPPPSSSQPPSPSSLQSLRPSPSSTSTNADTSRSTSTHGIDPTKIPRRATKYDVCFTISIYGTSVDSVDDVGAVFPWLSRLGWEKAAANAAFFAFTNLDDLPLPDVYQRILLNNSRQEEQKYRRWITYSRFPKFMAWTFDFIQEDCATVVYFDAWKTLWAKPERWKGMAQTLLPSSSLSSPSLSSPSSASSSSLSSVTNNNHTSDSFAPMFLMQDAKISHKVSNQWGAILNMRKDTPENVNATRSWMEAQPDYDADMMLYTNTQFMYVPTCPQWQRATTAFWNRYSLEEGSWRDQPLWAYILHHLQLRPAMPFGDDKSLILPSWENQKRLHSYNETQNKDAEMAATAAAAG